MEQHGGHLGEVFFVIMDPKSGVEILMSSFWINL